MSHLSTSNYPPTFITTSNLTPGYLWSTPHFSHPFRFHTWAHPITHPNLPPPPISYLGTFNYTPNFTTTSNFTTGHIQLPTHFHFHLPFHTWAPPIPLHFPLHFQFHNWAPPITYLILPPLPISHLGTSDYPPTFTTTCHFTPGLQLLLIFPTTSNFTLGTSHYPPNITTPYNFPSGHLWLPTHFHHHFHFHSWAPWITCPPSPPLPISHFTTFNYPPLLTNTSIFTHGQFQLPTHPDHHFHLHSIISLNPNSHP